MNVLTNPVEMIGAINSVFDLVSGAINIFGDKGESSQINAHILLRELMQECKSNLDIL